jgi:hypothetical protein
MLGVFIVCVGIPFLVLGIAIGLVIGGLM